MKIIIEKTYSFRKQIYPKIFRLENTYFKNFIQFLDKVPTVHLQLGKKKNLGGGKSSCFYLIRRDFFFFFLRKTYLEKKLCHFLLHFFEKCLSQNFGGGDFLLILT